VILIKNNIDKAIVGSIGCISISFVCWVLKSGEPLWALLLLIWLVNRVGDD